ncbi:MAG TPA: hypothetical protein VK708_01635 [Bryobacteraceae bacterium]|jgi:hypothetical protein|nr:hypothetical protein [Bryobacteraceae bacterium]
MKSSGVAKLVWALWPAILCAQDFSQRGFIESDLTLYPETAPNDSGHAVDSSLFRYEASYKALPWLRFAGSLDARFDTHEEVERTAHLDWQDRSLERPALSLREFNATIAKGKLTAVFGKQFIRWGKADILNPTDRFAPKDFLTVTDPDFLAVLAARVTYDTGTDSLDFVWQPRFTPSRTPLIDQRWTVLPQAVAGIALVDLGAEYPGRSAFGARWNHVGAGYEFSASFYDGFNYLPVFQGALSPLGNAIEYLRTYPALRLYGADAAVPLRWFTVKAEAAYYTSPDRQQDNYVIYVLQFERQIKELSIVAGYAGDAITARTPTLQFSPELGFARAVLAHAQYTIDSNRGVAVDAAVRQNGQGSWLRAEYSQAFGQHWRATAGYSWIRGQDNDFLGQYHRNSFALLALRYSF